mgnify:CR=1 FL=1
MQTPTGLMRTYLYSPISDDSSQQFPALIFYSEIFQQTPPIARMAMQFASQGYVVAVPEVYHEHEPIGTVLGYDDEGKNKGNAYKAKTKLSTFDNDARIVLEMLTRHQQCNGSLGVAGVCLGGHLAFRAGLNPEVKATCCMYPTDLHTGTLGEGQNADSLDRADEIQGELLMIWGRQDPHIPLDGRRKIHQALEQAGARFTWHEFNAEHAFMRDEGERYNPSLAHLCYELAFDLFSRNL